MKEVRIGEFEWFSSIESKVIEVGLELGSLISVALVIWFSFMYYQCRSEGRITIIKFSLLFYRLSLRNYKNDAMIFESSGTVVGMQLLCTTTFPYWSEFTPLLLEGSGCLSPV